MNYLQNVNKHFAYRTKMLMFNCLFTIYSELLGQMQVLICQLTMSLKASLRCSGNLLPPVQVDVI